MPWDGEIRRKDFDIHNVICYTIRTMGKEIKQMATIFKYRIQLADYYGPGDGADLHYSGLYYGQPDSREKCSLDCTKRLKETVEIWGKEFRPQGFVETVEEVRW